MNLARRLKALQEEKATIHREMTAILEEVGDKDWTPEQDASYKALEKKVESLDPQIARIDKLLKQERSMTHDVNDLNSDTDTEASDRDPVGAVRDNWQADPKCGYSKPRDFLMEVIEVAKNPGAASPQLRFLAAAGGDEQGGYADPVGGFFIPEGLAPGVMSVPADIDPTASRVTPVPMTSPIVKTNARVDKNHTTSVSGGLTVSRVPETQSPTASRQKYEQITLSATAQMGLAYATEQLLERSPVSFAALLDAGFKDEFAVAGLKERMRGTGAGEPLGILNSPCKIAVAKESMQAADTINSTNILKMRMRQWRYGNSIWMANPDTYIQLTAAHIALTNASVAIFVPGNGVDVPDTLLGRPIVFTDYCGTVGDEGDLVNVDWSQYLWGTLGPTDPQRAESVHVRFLNHERTFKFWIENDGQPWWRSAFTPYLGANTRSPIVSLAERS